MADQERRRVKITNKGPGPRTIFTSEGGETIPKGGFRNLNLNENDYKGIKPYVDLGHLELGEPDPEPETVATGDIGGAPLPSGNPVDAAQEQAGVDIVPASEGPEEDDETTPDETPIEGRPTDGEAGDDAVDELKPTHVEHRGFGRYYGLSGDEKVTKAMTEAEANAYAEEHGLMSPVVADPSKEDETIEEAPPPADETVGDENHTETPAEEA